MFISENHHFKQFEQKVWLSSPTMYPDSMDYVKEAYQANWMSTVGANINDVKRASAKRLAVTMPLPFPPARQRCILP